MSRSFKTSTRTIAIILTLAMLISIAPLGTLTAVADSTEETTMNKIAIYTLSSNIFNQFIGNPSVDILNETTEGISKHVYPDQGEVFYRGLASPLRINNLLMSFAGDTAELEKYLAQNGITATVENTALIYNKPKIPVAIWIKTDQSNFFIAVEDEPISGLTALPNNWNVNNFTYVYTLYEQAAYCEEFKIDTRVEDAKLIVKGKDITAGNHVKINFEYQLAEIPITALLKALGVKIESPRRNILFLAPIYKILLSLFDATVLFIPQTKERPPIAYTIILFSLNYICRFYHPNQNETAKRVTYNNRLYILDITNCSIVDVAGFDMISGLAGGYSYVGIVGDELVLDNNSTAHALREMGIDVKIDIDFDELTVTIE